DGIRDKLVTGVQRCALPICGKVVAKPTPTRYNFVDALHPTPSEECTMRFTSLSVVLLLVTAIVTPAQDAKTEKPPFVPLWPEGRSEERRVGKERKCRWSRSR